MSRKGIYWLFVLLSVVRVSALDLKMGVLTGQLLFDVSEFDVEAGSELTITFHNNGFISHNLLFTDKGEIEKVFNTAMAMGEAGMQTGFVPPILEVLSAAPLLNPGDRHTMTFTVPDETGDYGYICTFPGHGNRMRGVMHVVPKGTPLRPINRVEDLAVQGLTAVSDHEVTPFPNGSLARPMVVRTFMPDIGFDEAVVLPNHERGKVAKGYSPNSGKDTDSEVKPIRGLPAAMAVGFGDALSICWDTVECRSLYAWTGGFLDMTKYWGKGTGGGRKRNGYIPDLMGSLIFRAESAHPIRAGRADDIVAPVYLGYRVVNHVPEFMYKLGDTFVQEQITPGRHPNTIEHRLFVHGADLPVFYVVDDDLRTRVSANEGTWDGSTLKLDAATAKTGFTITVGFSDPMKVGGGSSGIKLPAFTSEGGVIGSVKRWVNEEKAEAPVIVEGGFKKQLLVYGDRKFVYAEIPKYLAGADIVQSFNNDKKNKAKVRYEVELREAATLFILVDTRMDGPPRMTKGKGTLTRTSLECSVDIGFDFAVYAMNVDAGTYAFGSQQDNSFYAIAARKGQIKELK